MRCFKYKHKYLNDRLKILSLLTEHGGSLSVDHILLLLVGVLLLLLLRAAAEADGENEVNQQNASYHEARNYEF